MDRPGRPSNAPTWVVWPLILLAAAGVAAFLTYPKAFTGDFAEITIESIAPTGPGAVEIRYRGRLSVGSQVFEVTRRGDREYKTHRRGAADRFPGRPEPLETEKGAGILRMYSVNNEQGLPGNPDEVAARLLVESGRTYRIRPGKPLHLYQYTASDGVPIERFLEVLPLKSP